MRRKRLIAARERLLGRLPLTGELLRGSLLERTIRNHARNCNKCASGGGHRLTVLTVSYPGGRTRQFSLRGEMVPTQHNRPVTFDDSNSFIIRSESAEMVALPSPPVVASRTEPVSAFVTETFAPFTTPPV